MRICTATTDDIPALARIRAAEWCTEDYWQTRIAGYLGGTLHPQKALAPRVIYVAEDGDIAVGLIAGHLTHRYDCDGELEWIDVIKEHRSRGVAAELLQTLARWFVEHDAKRICVDVAPENIVARKFYRRYGAVDLNPHWLVWPDIQTALQPLMKD